MNKISFPPAFGYWLLLCLAPLPFFYSLFHYSANIAHLRELDERIELVHTKKEQSEAVQKRQHSVLSSLAQSDPYYIDKNLESLTFLESEMKKMEALCAETHVDEAISKRLHFLKEGSNRLLFAEEKIRTKDSLREVSERQQQPVEINEEDLKKLLCLIEGVTIWPYGPKEGRPQLVLQNFQLDKKRYSPQDQVFHIQMNIIKRESANPKADP